MTDSTPDMMPGLTPAQRAAAVRLELAPAVDLTFHFTESRGWSASLNTGGGVQQTVFGAEIGPWLLSTAETWATPIP